MVDFKRLFERIGKSDAQGVSLKKLEEQLKAYEPTGALSFYLELVNANHGEAIARHYGKRLIEIIDGMDEQGLLDKRHVVMLGHGLESVILQMDDHLAVRIHHIDANHYAPQIPERLRLAQVLQAYDVDREDGMLIEIIPNLKSGRYPNFKLGEATTADERMLILALRRMGYEYIDRKPENLVIFESDDGVRVPIVLDPGAVVPQHSLTEEQRQGIAFMNLDSTVLFPELRAEFDVFNGPWDLDRMDEILDSLEIPDFRLWRGVQEELGFTELRYKPFTAQAVVTNFGGPDL